MKNPLEVLKDLKKVILNADVQLAERTDEEGVVYTAEKFEDGFVLYIGGSPAPAGNYKFPDGLSLETNAEGVITQVSMPAAEAEEATPEVEAEVEVEASTVEVEVEASETPPEPDPEPEVETLVAEVTLTAVEELISTQLQEMEASIVGVVSDLIKDLNTKIEEKVKQVELSATDNLGSREEQPQLPNGAMTAHQRKLNQFLERTQIN